MAVKARATVTISRIIDISAITRYYMLQSSTAAAPAKPTTVPALIGKNAFNIAFALNVNNWVNYKNGYFNYCISGLKPNAMYTFSMSANNWSGVKNNGFYVSINNTPSVYSSHPIAHSNGVAGYNPKKGTLESNSSGEIYLQFYNVSADRLSTFFNGCPNFQLELGSAATEYQKYVTPNWQLTEPTYTSGSTNTLYFVDCTEFTNGTFKYSEVSKSSSYEAAKEAYNKAQNAQNTANSAKDYTDKMKAQHGYQYKYDITINGDAGTYYPVVLRGGDQNVMREILVSRGYSEQAPEEWNGHPTVHGISLLLKMKCNFGGWGGVNYSWWIHDFEEMYGHVFASAGWCMSCMGFYIFLRGGGETGALYHIYSDQPLNVTYMNGTSPAVYYNSDRIGWTGGTSDNPTYSWNAPAPRNYTEAIKNEIDNKRYINLASDAHSRVISAETKIEQNKNAIALRATKTEVETTVNNIKVGGRNILLNSSFKKSTDEWNVATPVISGEGYLYADDISPVEHSINCGISRKNLLSAMSLFPTVTNNAIPIHFKAGQKYTISFTTTYTAWRLMFFGTDKNGTAFDNSSTDVNKYISEMYTGTTGRLQHASNHSGNTFTFTCNEDCIITAIVFWNVSNETGKTYSKFQLEIGDTATAYTPYVSNLKDVKIKRLGKNLIQYPYIETTKTLNGITFTDNGDGTITANGTATSSAYFNLSSNICVKDLTVTLSGCPSGGSTSRYFILLYYSANGYPEIGNGLTKTPTDNVNVQIRIAQGATLNNLTFKPQLELGSTATDYEPYIMPIEYTPSSNGTVSGIKSISPNMTLMSDTDGVILRVDYRAGAFVEKYGKQCIKFSNKDLKYNKYCMQQLIGKIEPNTQYTLSGWILSEHVTKGTTNPLLSLYTELSYDNNGIIGVKNFTNIPFDVNTGTGSWKYVSTTFTSSDEA